MWRRLFVGRGRQNQEPPTGGDAKTQDEPTQRDLWAEAFDKLDKSTQEQLHLGKVQNENQNSLKNQIDGLLDEVRAKQRVCEGKAWKFTVGHHEIVLRDQAVIIINFLTQIGDIAIPFAPAQASIPWSIVKNVLKIPVSESAQMCALLAGTAAVSAAIYRGMLYQRIYAPNNTPPEALENLHSALVNLYQSCLELLACSSKLFSANAARQTAYALFHPGKAVGLISQLDKLETKLASEVQLCESSRSAAADEQLVERMRLLEAPMSRVDSNVASLLQKMGDAEQQETLSWISPVKYGAHHDTVREARIPDTCQWLLRHTRFQEWEDFGSSAIVWLQGSPGAGKTFLTSRVIDHIRARLKSSPNDEGFAFFYCNRNEEERRKPLNVLRSFVRQLSSPVAKSRKIRTSLCNLVREAQRSGSELSMEVCKAQLLESINLYPKTTLVLDALDECDPVLRSQLFKTIDFLIFNAERPLKVFISSRPDFDIWSRFVSRPNIEIRATDNGEDITRFVNEQITEHQHWNRMSPELRETIITTLLERSNGMFQWANLQVKQLLLLKVEDDIKERLGKLPKDLGEAYKEIYHKAASDRHAKAIVDSACKWVMCAIHPLTTIELVSALSLDIEGDKIAWRRGVDEDLMRDLCNNLLVLDSQLKPSTRSSLIHSVIGHSMCNITIPISREENKQMQALVSGEVDIAKLLIDYGAQVDLPLENGKLGSALATAAFKGNVGMAKLLIDHDAQVDLLLKNGQFGSALDAAASRGKVDMAKLLIDHGAQVDLLLENGQFGSALAAAAARGEVDMAELLIDHGAQVDLLLENGQFGSALATAAARGEVDMAELLIDHGAQVDLLLENGQFGSALAAAVVWGELGVAKLLIDHGAQVNVAVQCGDFDSPLAAAICSNYTYFQEDAAAEMVQLLNSRADFDAVLDSGHFGRAVVLAAQRNHETMITCLVEISTRTADQERRAADCAKALAVAARWGSVEATRAMLHADDKFKLKPSGAHLQAALRASRESLEMAFGSESEPRWWDSEVAWEKWKCSPEREHDRRMTAKLLLQCGAVDEM
ncbi:hypothetical protein GQ53DRAFT_850827 [Thozetella sp. PMI_491]|nr:hypothetical protein GQ53DRAFT_850827 [Thozetella sp. PMI_491]